MRPIDKARIIAKEYSSNCAELNKLLARRDYSPARVEIAVRTGRISKPVEAAAIGKMENERALHLRLAVDAVDYALRKVSHKREGELTAQLVDMVYLKKSYTLYGAAFVIGISERTAKRYNLYFLKMIALSMGYFPSEE